MKYFSRIVLVTVLLLVGEPNLSADSYTASDRQSASVPGAGFGGFTRLNIDQDIPGWNYSIPPTAKNNSFVSVLQPCEIRETDTCILSVKYRNSPMNNWELGELLPVLNPNMDGNLAFTSEDGVKHFYGPVFPDVDTPLGGTSSTWRLRNAKHLGGDSYLLSASISNIHNSNIQQDKNDLNISLKAIQWLRESRLTGFESADQTYFSTTEFNMPENVEFQIEIQLGQQSSKLGSWYNSRLKEPNISILNGILKISGKPAFVPVAGTPFFRCDSLSLEKQKLLPINQTFSDFLVGPSCNGVSGSSRGTGAYDPNAFKIFDLWENEIVEYGKNSYWSIQAHPNFTFCSHPGFAGVVSSDAMIYSKYPPSFDVNTSELTFRIASTHTDKSGNVNKGNFNLAINEEFARCLWKVDPTGLTEAKAQIIYEDGSSSVGTTTFNVRNGWVYINISNFTFSSPRISVKLEKKFATPVTMKNSKNETTITCIKGKAIKKVKSVNPKCPAGYKKI